MNLFNKDFGNRVWGASFVLWTVAVFIKMPIWYVVLSGLVFCYFLLFGNSRFDENYKKII